MDNNSGTQTSGPGQKAKDPLADLFPPEARAHLKAAGKELKQGLEAMLPPGMVERRRAARRELLLAARSFIDAALQRIDKAGRPPTV
jgi:hypothetical protein